MLGREVNLPVQVTMEECSQQISYGEYVDNLQLMVCKAYTITRTPRLGSVVVERSPGMREVGGSIPRPRQT